MNMFAHKGRVRPVAAGFRGLAPALALGFGLLLLPGCDRDQVSRTVVTPEAPAAPAPLPAHGSMPAMPPGAMPPAGSMPGGELPPPPRPRTALKWVAPKGWTETQGSGMRFATLTPPAGAGKAEVSVVVLPGPAGGELANVNRWRGQIGLPPLDEAALAAARKSVTAKAGTVAVYDFTSEGQVKSRMVTGLLASADGNTWFFKLMGDADPVGKAKPGFMHLLETLHLD